MIHLSRKKIIFRDQLLSSSQVNWTGQHRFTVEIISVEKCRRKVSDTPDFFLSVTVCNFPCGKYVNCITVGVYMMSIIAILMTNYSAIYIIEIYDRQNNYTCVLSYFVINFFLLRFVHG